MQIPNAAILGATKSNQACSWFLYKVLSQWVRRPLLCVALLGCGLSVCLAFPATVLAGTGVNVETERSYRIAPGSLIESFNQFSTQSGIKLSFDAAVLEGWVLVPCDAVGISAQAVNNQAYRAFKEIKTLTDWLKADFVAAMNTELPDGVQGDND